MITEITIAVASLMVGCVIANIYYKNKGLYERSDYFAKGFYSKSSCLSFLCNEVARNFLNDAIVKRAIRFDKTCSLEIFKGFVLYNRDSVSPYAYCFVVENVLKNSTEEEINDLEVLCGLLECDGLTIVNSYVKSFLESARKILYSPSYSYKSLKANSFLVNSLYAIVKVRGGAEQTEAARMLSMHALPVLDDEQKETVLDHFPNQSFAAIQKEMKLKVVSKAEDESGEGFSSVPLGA